MTDKEIVKAKKLLKKLEEAYNAYYDTSKGMPYDLDTTIRETAICLEHSIDEINSQKAEIDHFRKHTKKVKANLKYYLDTNEENGVVWIPAFAIDNIVKEMTEDEGK